MKPLAPVLNVSNPSATIESGKNVTFRCRNMTDRYPSDTIISYTFLKDNKNISYQVMDNGYLLTSSSPSDSGNYTCIGAVNGVHSDPSNVHALTIVGK